VAHPTAPTLEQELRAIDTWWREAGVDHVFADAPVNWLAEPGDDPAEEQLAVEPAVAPKPVELLADGPANWPMTLDTFDQWWLAKEALALGPHRRIAPRGPADAALMVLVGQPAADDTETLLSGAEGTLLANMLAAFGLAPEDVRVASLLPSHLPHPDWQALDRFGWGALARHHLALAAPKRLLVFGQVALPLLGHDPAQGAAAFRGVTLESGVVPAFAARGLDTLLLRPRLQAGLWRRWLEWTDG
jgi:DNA polymerase